jgi:membrane associated rhomboid family serine protease
MNSIFANLPQVTKNLLILNALFYLATYVLEAKGIDLQASLSMYSVYSPSFKPFQIVTHFFMHGSFFHLLFNMFGLITFGSMLERVWGAKRFAIFYFACALGAAAIYNIIGSIHIYHVLQDLNMMSINKSELNQVMLEGNNIIEDYKYHEICNDYIDSIRSRVLGASGAIYGLLVGAAMLFPNTQMMLLFPPIPIKLKYLALALIVIALYSNFKDNPGDNVAHLAHLGGAAVGFIMIMIWKRNKTTFY